ncbi:MAG: hypothetical protein ACM3NQ_03140 [Bacteroidales bacterium]
MWTTIVLMFTMMSSLTLIVALPTMLGVALIKLRRERDVVPLLGFLAVAGGLAIGMSVAWYFLVVHEGWRLSPLETAYATVHSDIYGGQIEDAAEDYIFFTLFIGNVGAMLSGIAGWLAIRRHNRLALTNRAARAPARRV